MTWMRRIRERLSEMLDRRRFDAELDEEIGFHLEREAERLMAAGLSPEAARAQARRSFGEVAHVKEEAREVSGMPWLETALRDARYALRGLRRSPAFAASAIVTLALGIGPTSAIFSVVDGVLLEPLPYPEPDRLVRIVEQNSPEYRWNLSVADFLGIEERQEVFESVAAWQTGGAALTGRGTPEQIDVARVTADWFRVLGVEPAEGRGFLPGEDRPGSEPVVVLGRPLHDRLFGAEASGVGATITLDGTAHTVVGVLERGRSSLAGVRADAWPVLRLDTPPRRGPFLLGGIGRLRADRSLEDARVGLDAISREIFPLWVDTGFRDEQARMTPYGLKQMLLGDVGSSLWLMLGAVAGVLLIAVSNVGNLFMVRAASRAREMALRASLGATRTRLAGQLVVESLVVAALGGLAGIALAWSGLEALRAAELAIPRLEDVGLDGSVLALVASITLGSALLFGLAPLLRLASGAPAPGGGRAGDGAGTSGWSRVRAALVTAEFAIAFSLTAGAALLVASFVRLQRVDPGYDPSQTLALQLALPSVRYEGYEELQGFWRDALVRLDDAPGVEAVGLAAGLPPAGRGSVGTNNFDLLDQPVATGESEPVALWNYASPGFFEALRVSLLRGRIYDQRDLDGGAPVVVVSESWERRHYPDGGAIGAQLYAGGDRSVAMTVVGVVEDVKYVGLDGSDDAAVYEPHWQANLRGAWLVARGPDAGDGLVEQVRGEIATLDAELPLSSVQMMADRTSGSLARPRQWTVLLGLFAAVGLVLACVGVYGVLSYWVGMQRREIGIRISLGAEPGSVRGLVIGRGMALAAAGVALGVGVSLYVARWMRALLFGVSPTDPLALAAVAGGLIAVAFLACALPAHAATRIDPIRTLKGE